MPAWRRSKPCCWRKFPGTNPRPPPPDDGPLATDRNAPPGALREAKAHTKTRDTEPGIAGRKEKITEQFDFSEQIRVVYRSAGSIKETARRMGISAQSVRRVLIQLGEYTNPTAQQIQRLYEGGKSAGEIAAALHMGKNTVIAYLPYSRRPYICPQKTKNAARIKAWREKNKKNKKQGDI